MNKKLPHIAIRGSFRTLIIHFRNLLQFMQSNWDVPLFTRPKHYSWMSILAAADKTSTSDLCPPYAIKSCESPC